MWRIVLNFKRFWWRVFDQKINSSTLYTDAVGSLSDCRISCYYFRLLATVVSGLLKCYKCTNGWFGIRSNLPLRNVKCCTVVRRWGNPAWSRGHDSNKSQQRKQLYYLNKVHPFWFEDICWGGLHLSWEHCLTNTMLLRVRKKSSSVI